MCIRLINTKLISIKLSASIGYKAVSYYGIPMHAIVHFFFKLSDSVALLNYRKKMHVFVS